MPCRFLTMVSHLVLLLTILLARDDYVKACLPFDFEEDAFGRKDVELVREKRQFQIEEGCENSYNRDQRVERKAGGGIP